MKEIKFEVSDEAYAKLDEAARRYGFESPAEWATELLKGGLVGYAQQQQTAAAQKLFDKAKREHEALFDKA